METMSSFVASWEKMWIFFPVDLTAVFVGTLLYETLLKRES